MYPGVHAVANPDKPAVIMADTGQTLTYQQLEERSLRLANAFRDRGLVPRDHVAVVAENRLEIVEALWAALRTGTLITAVNRHLTAEEAAYIVHDCGAKALLLSGELETADELAGLCADVPQRIGIGRTPDGFERYEDVLAAASAVKPEREPRGDDMLYSSGTTGRPKGILPAPRELDISSPEVPLIQLFTQVFGFDSDTVYLSPAPLYHAAPLRFVMTTIARGGTVVVMPRFDARTALEVIQEHRVTHSQWVPTMFIRMLKLPQEERESFDVSSMRCAIHAAAPCPAEVKRKMIEWWGPVIFEYYASTESAGLTLVNSEESLRKPGTVGRDGLMGTVHICGPDGEELPAGQTGIVYFEVEEGREPFEYFGDPAKTAESRHPDHPRWVTTGDMGWLDEDRYLFLADRTSFLIITGGVNIYPQEIENALALHPDVRDVAVVGEPDEELGEVVVAYLEPEDHVRPEQNLGEEVRQWLDGRLSRFKIPRRLHTIDALPRTPTGKLVKRKLDPSRALS
ncbi:MAG TPA: acyl-CoA synthetase [Brevibacterium senegalense]|uniref:Acyl-CoA synthetase n=1 Tax=Brevibacterium senegalense TaxID=1033736 RepID=A0A921MF20_9MICO|nr:acyl-CoA synthetase [Brevibacterium senegalense]